MHKLLAVLRRVRGLASDAARPRAPAGSKAKKDKAKGSNKLGFENWQRLNPGGTFKEYYVASILDALSGKRPHATLGPLTHEGSLERAESAALALIGMGVPKSDVVVDYGCGTLRVGKTLIEYLEPSHYVGLDIDRRILDAGLAMLPPGVAEKKQPILDVIGDEALDRVASMYPKWILSKGVLHHVPPSDLSEFFGNVSRLTTPDTTILLWARFSKGTTQKASSRSWFHGIDDIIALARRFQLEGEIRELGVNTVVRLRRSSATTTC
jgi:hypothetical protein